ncbi:ABC transporter ATP-binding protein [Arthrobacter sp. StoSoilB5]|uniref:ABC transporter ATP-binding protein n=1 Tax=Arthrobacter sp. StoSoilB5 TaxID=2830992 RepID=UPI001CC7F0B0|nr:ABC transporter ATP-binding protein [Arthrobacter sp. StoSoilB5]
MGLHPTDLSIHDGDFLAITGPSGAGKSTLMNVIGLLDRPSAGLYMAHGETVDLTDERTILRLRGRLFGFVFQSFHLLPGRSVLDNVEMGMLYSIRSRQERKERAFESLRKVGLAHYTSKDPRQLSGGEKQRVAFARALALEPSVLLCDEPTGNLDSTNSGKVLGLLQELNSSGITVVLITHDQKIAESAKTRVVVRDGRVELNDET